MAPKRGARSDARRKQTRTQQSAPSSSNSNSKYNPPKKGESPVPKCECTDPCTTALETTTATGGASGSGPGSGTHLRKVISHIFGRNKTSTKQFPSQVWVHYCRKHYQRARYRATQWAFMQCELLLDSLDRMEGWGGVQDFQVDLRLREKMRREKGQQDRGHDQYLYGDQDEHQDDEVMAKSAKQKHANSQEKGEEPNPEETKRKKPTIQTAPVPEWLENHQGSNKSFDDIRNIIYQLKDYFDLLERENRENEIRFPDIEILPTFKPWVTGEEEGIAGSKAHSQSESPE